jgi:6-phosphogluconolactonase
MSFSRAARAVLAGQEYLRPVLAAIVVVFLTLPSISCNGNGRLPVTGTGNTAYVTVPNNGSVLKLHIDGANGAVKVEGSTPAYVGTSPRGLALARSKKFLYVANSLSNNISTFKIAGDGSLSLRGTTSDGPNAAGPWGALIDPSGQYLLVTNSGLPGTVSVFSIDSSSGALTSVSGSPFSANDGPSEMAMPPADNLLYVSNPSSGMVTAFTFDTSLANCGYILCKVAGSPFYSGPGATALALDNSGQFLYVANTSAKNSGTNVIGNISAFSLNTTTGVLTPVSGSPYAPAIGTGPSTLVAVPNSQFLYATTPGSSYSIWLFTIDSQTGQLTIAADSPFSQTAGGLFALVDTNGGFFFIGGGDSKGGIAAYTYDTNTGQPTAVLNSPFSTNGQVPGKMVIVP